MALRGIRGTQTHLPDPATPLRPSCAKSFASKIRGRRECRALDAPAASRVEKNTRVSHHGHAEITRHSPRGGFTAYFALSPVTGLVCHRRQRNCFRQLDASVGASGPHDFAVRAHRHSSLDMPRPSRPAPNVRDDRDTPPLWVRDGDKCRSDLGEKNTGIFLREGLDRIR
jgi:hypothetical protein